MIVTLRQMMVPRRLIMFGTAIALLTWCALSLTWDWIPRYWEMGLIQQGIWTTIWILCVSWTAGMFMAVWIGLAQAAGPWYLAIPAKAFCSIIRGTPLLLQLWMFYYGIGSLFPQFPWIRETVFWPYLREAWPFAILSLTLSCAGYEGEVMRGAFLSVPNGQLEAARAFGMPRLTALRRIWLPLAIQRVLPTLGGETVLLLKATPLVATITVVDIYSVADRVRQDTFIIYEPLLMMAALYMILTAFIVLIFLWMEKRIPSRVN
jgi:polar amino acid transport system permease protein